MPWNPQMALKNELAETTDVELTHLFFNGEEVDSISDLTTYATSTDTLTAYSDNYEFVTQDPGPIADNPRIVAMDRPSHRNTISDRDKERRMKAL